MGCSLIEGRGADPGVLENIWVSNYTQLNVFFCSNDF